MFTDVVTTRIGNDPARAELIAGAVKADHMAVESTTAKLPATPGQLSCAR